MGCTLTKEGSLSLNRLIFGRNRAKSCMNNAITVTKLPQITKVLKVVIK